MESVPPAQRALAGLVLSVRPALVPVLGGGAPVSLAEMQVPWSLGH